MRLNPLSNDRIKAADSSIRDRVAGTRALEIWAFVLPAISFLEVKLVGRLIVSELLALALLPWLLRSQDRLRIPRWLIGLGVAWLVFQIITDIVVRSAFADWTRGWAAIVFTLIDLLALLVLVATPRRARIFAAGLAAGGLLGYVFTPNPYAATDPWKWAFAIPVAFLLAALVAGPAAARRPWIAVVAFAAVGVINAFLLFRSLSGVALITATYLLFAIVAGRLRDARVPEPARSAAGVAFYGAAALAVFVGLNTAAASGLLGEAARTKFDAQAGVTAPSASPIIGTSAAPGSSPVVGSGPAGSPTPAPVSNPIGVLAGGRSELLTSPRAILDSPILGHGSWAKDARYVELQRQGLIELGVPNGNEPTDPTLIPTHSYLLGSWVWAGLGGGLFWLAVVLLAVWMIARIYVVRPALSPLIVFSTTFLLWNIAFSPYGNTQRLFATFGIAVCLLGLRLLGEDASTPATPVERGA